MKSIIFRLVAPHAIKKGLHYAAQISTMIVDALRGILQGDGLTETQRGHIAIVLTAAVSIRDFLIRLSALFGSSHATGPLSLESLIEKSAQLDNLTGEL
jgi:hypothetical protein